MVILENKLYRHKKSGHVYLLVELGFIQLFDLWVPCVHYRKYADATETMLYTRVIEEFIQKFEEVKI